MSDTKTLTFQKDEVTIRQYEDIKKQLDELATRQTMETRKKIVLQRLVLKMAERLGDDDLTQKCAAYVNAVNEWETGEGPTPPL